MIYGLGMASKIIIIVVVSLIVMGSLGFLLTRARQRTMEVAGSTEDGDLSRLRETGKKARALIVSIESTGVILNKVTFGHRATFRIRPLDGSEEFQAEKKLFLEVSKTPRVGDVWLGWYDLDDPSKIEVAQPDLGDPQISSTLKEFGIANPLE